MEDKERIQESYAKEIKETALTSKAIAAYKSRLKEKVMELIRMNRHEANRTYDGSEESNKDCFKIDLIRKGMEKVLTLIDETK